MACREMMIVNVLEKSASGDIYVFVHAYILEEVIHASDMHAQQQWVCESCMSRERRYCETERCKFQESLPELRKMI